jgi:hypothetical protein
MWKFFLLLPASLSIGACVIPPEQVVINNVASPSSETAASDRMFYLDPTISTVVAYDTAKFRYGGKAASNSFPIWTVMPTGSVDDQGIVSPDSVGTFRVRATVQFDGEEYSAQATLVATYSLKGTWFELPPV